MEWLEEAIREDLVCMDQGWRLGAREIEAEVMGIVCPAHRKQVRIHFDEGAAIKGVAKAAIEGFEGGLDVYEPPIREAITEELLRGLHEAARVKVWELDQEDYGDCEDEEEGGRYEIEWPDE